MTDLVRSVTPSESTVGDVEWSAQFVATTNRDVDLGDTFVADFAKNGVPMGIKLYGDIETLRSLVWNANVEAFSDLGVTVSQGDVVSMCTIYKQEDSDWLPVWTA